jgi:IclR family transcriptional regulator, pca regulon regulatory protein
MTAVGRGLTLGANVRKVNERSESRSVRASTSDFVQSVERVLAVICAFGAESPQLTLSDVARATGLTRATARRFLLTLVELGYVRNEGRYFSLRPRVLELGYAYLSGLSLPEVAAPYMEDLVATVHESSSLAVLDGKEIVYVARVPTKRIMTVTIAVGTRFPAYATSMGRVLLADRSPTEIERYLATVDLVPLTRRTITDPVRLRTILDGIRTQGYAVVDQELEDGIRSMAAPIHGANQEVIAAINVSAHASRVSMDTLRKEFLPPLLDTAAKIDADFSSLGP